MKTTRIDHVTVVTPDVARAEATFARIFALPPARVDAESPAGAKALAIAGARIDFVPPVEGTALAHALAASGEGMAALCLEVADLEAAASELRAAGVSVTTSISGSHRALEIDPTAAHGVRLTLVQRS
jgi:catechol 2,3-dioxygenase-like lactoylglutathione lyase family enzyme